MLVDLTEQFDVMRGSAFACLRGDRQVEIEASVRREWDRHPELREQYGTYERFRVACRQWRYA